MDSKKKKKESCKRYFY